MTPRLSNSGAWRARARSARRKLPLLAACLLACPCVAQDHTRAGLRAEVSRLQGTVQTCAAAASGCDAGNVPQDETVAAGSGRPKFTMRWDWLRETLDAARNAKPEDRRHAMDASAARLTEIDREAAGSEPIPAAEFRNARSEADDLLASPEFGAVAPASWWDRLVARFWRAVDRLFTGVGQLGAHAPWIGVAMEWVFFVGSAVGLLFFLRRNFQRQRLAASLRGEQAARGAWDREATDWAELAEQAAGAGEWREAVHSLYWAAIVRLESRRAWRHNPARTPREYVRLLKPGSPQRESLGGLTGLLERVWYGLRSAEEQDYRRARTWFERLGESGSGATAGAPGAVQLMGQITTGSERA